MSTALAHNTAFSELLNHVLLAMLLAALVAIGVLTAGSLDGSGMATLSLVLCYSAAVCLVVWFSRYTVTFHPGHLIAIVVFIELILGPYALLKHGLYQPDWLLFLGSREEYLAHAMLVSGLGIGALFLGMLTLCGVRRASNSNGMRRPRCRENRALLTQIAAGCLVVALIVSVLRLSSLQDYRFSERRVANAGRGYLMILHVFGYLGLMLTAYLIFARRTTRLWALVSLGAAAIISGMPYGLSGHRGGALYPILFIAIVYVETRRRRHLLRLIILLVPLILALHLTTLNVRRIMASGEASTADFLQNELKAFPKSFGHLELLAACIAMEERGIELPETFFSSFFNWIPRAFYPQKPLTSGPELNIYFSSKVLNRHGEHLTSYTTGPLVELYLAGGLPAVLVGMFMIGAIVSFLVHRYQTCAINSQVLIFYTYQSYLLGWDLWVNDLGGFVNNEVCFMIAYALFSFGMIHLGAHQMRNYERAAY